MPRYFSFKGRLSRSAFLRLQLKLLLLMTIVFVVALSILVSDAPNVIAATPLILMPIIGLVWLTGWTRRLHDVGLHASGEVVRHVAMLVVAGTAIAGLEMMPDDAPDWLFGGAVVCLVFALLLFSSSRWNMPEWRQGDADANEFGPPPA